MLRRRAARRGSGGGRRALRRAGRRRARHTEQADDEPDGGPLAVYGDAAYGAGALLEELEQAGAEANCKVQPPVARGGLFTKDTFEVDLEAATVTCPTGVLVPLRPQAKGQIARFAKACQGCPLATRCTTSKSGRTIAVGPTRNSSAAPAPARPTPTGKPPTPPPVPRSSAKSPT